MIDLPISIYFEWQWWEKHYQHRHGRPDRIDWDWTDRTYLGRQRFLYEQFAEFGLGQSQPALDLDFVSRVLPHNCVIMPVTFGMAVTAKAEGGWHWHSFSEEQMRTLQPVDMAETPAGEIITREREHRLARYGRATRGIDIGSPVNTAFLLRGQEFYADLIGDSSFAQDYLETITTSISLAHRFVCGLFGPEDCFGLGNCNASAMSPVTYVATIREHDSRLVQYAAQLNNAAPCCAVHHCDVPAEPFAEAYSAIPGIRSLQASYHSDLRRIHQVMPHVSFSAMISPVDLIQEPPSEVERHLERCLADGAHDLAIWNIDSASDPEQMTALLHNINEIAGRYGRSATFSVIPMSWEELDWEFPQYH